MTFYLNQLEGDAIIDMDADRKNITWNNLYKYIYTTKDAIPKQIIGIKGWEFQSLFDFNNIEDGKCKILKSTPPAINDPRITDFSKHWNDFEISGDTDWGGGIIIGKEKYQFSNFSLLPVTGGMNNKKGTTYKDSLDWFIYILSEYYLLGDIKRISFVCERLWYNYQYPKCSTGILTLGTLVSYLNLFDDIYDYCEKIYLISDSNYVDSLIKQGKRTEENGICRITEMKLAEEYFEYKSLILKNLLPTDLHYILDEDINSEKYQ